MDCHPCQDYRARFGLLRGCFGCHGLVRVTNPLLVLQRHKNASSAIFLAFYCIVIRIHYSSNSIEGLSISLFPIFFCSFSTLCHESLLSFCKIFPTPSFVLRCRQDQLKNKNNYCVRSSPIRRVVRTCHSAHMLAQLHFYFCCLWRWPRTMSLSRCDIRCQATFSSLVDCAQMWRSHSFPAVPSQSPRRSLGHYELCVDFDSGGAAAHIGAVSINFLYDHRERKCSYPRYCLRGKR